MELKEKGTLDYFLDMLNGRDKMGSDDIPSVVMKELNLILQPEDRYNTSFIRRSVQEVVNNALANVRLRDLI